MAQINNFQEQESLTSLTERHKSILDILQLQGSVSVSDLAERLDVSEVTIRKDLSSLEKQNKLQDPRKGDSDKSLHRRPPYQ
mgnify:CR=1 FL=1